MDVSLTDLLTCPRCGPTYGLVLLPEEVRERRVVTGVLGCPNCRERYAVEGGVADFGGAAEEAGGVEEAAGAPDREGAVRLAALLGLTEAGGTVLLTGPAAAYSALLGEVVPEVAVIAVGGGGSGGGGVSWLRVGGSFPFRSGSLRGVALTGGWAGVLEEGARLLAPAGRLVVEPAPADARARVEVAGLRVLLDEGGSVVAGRPGR